ncbi:MAG: hypothetical protein LBI28_04280 [Treponema sp.]|nr:hypothetical protein [Treponema sp.]
MNSGTAFYEPNEHIYEGWNTPFFSFAQLSGSPLGQFTESYKIKVKRHNIPGTGYYDGTVDLVIFFGQNTVINGSTTGIYFQEPGSPEPKLNNSVFVLHFTVRSDVARP